MSATTPRHGLKAFGAADAQNVAPGMGGRP